MDRVKVSHMEFILAVSAMNDDMPDVEKTEKRMIYTPKRSQRIKNKRRKGKR